MNGAQIRIEGDVLLQELLAAGEPPYALNGTRRRTPEELEVALAGRFQVFARLDELTELRPEIDWAQNPFGNLSWCAQLHTLRFLDVLYSSPREHRSAALARGREIVLDWVSANRRGDPGVDQTYAWSDKISGDRAPYIAYILRAAGARGELSAGDAEALLRAAIEHGEFLADEANYVPGSNHGLAMDFGLVLLASQLPFVDRSERWRRLGIDRFVASLGSHVSAVDGVHLEHSPDYHVMVAKLAVRLRAKGRVEDARLDALIDRMAVAGAWLTAPDGRTPNVGDSDGVAVPKWMGGTTTVRGLRTFADAGYACVRDGDSYLLLASGHHSHVHKHADDLSFVLHEGGQTIVGDAGKYAYLPRDPARRYARSCFAHNVLVVDGADFPWKHGRPYGSGVLASGSGAGWHAVRASNPLLRDQGVDHERTIVYRPRELLVILDEVRAEAEHEYTRLVHFGPDVSVAAIERGVRFSCGDLSGSLVDCGPAAVTCRTACGERDPQLQGWTFRGYREWLPVGTAVFDIAGADRSLALAMRIGDGPPVRCRAWSEGDGLTLLLDLGEDLRMVELQALEGQIAIADRSVTAEEVSRIGWPPPARTLA